MRTKNRLKESFKPTKKKVIISIVITFIWFLMALIYNWILHVLCKEGINYGFKGCIDYYSLLIISMWHHCSHYSGICTPLSAVISQYFWIIIFPFGLTYLILSIISYAFYKNKKKK